MTRREAAQFLGSVGGSLSIAASRRVSLTEAINAEIDHAKVLDSSFIGILVKNLDTGKTLYDRNAARLFTPASNNKLFTTALALARLGPDHRFITTVLAEGPLEDGVLRGNLALIGSGDPSMSDRMYPYAISTQPSNQDPLRALDELAGQVAAKGIKSVSGDVIADDSRYPWARYPLGWTIGDMPQNQGAAVSACTINDNIVRVRIEPRQTGELAKLSVKPPAEYFRIENRIRTIAGNGIAMHYKRELDSRDVVFWGNYGADHAPAVQTLAIPEPALYTAMAFREALIRHGVTVSGEALARHCLLQDIPDPEKGDEYPHPPGLEVARRTSPPLLQILQVIDKVSHNLHAELVLREVGAGRRNMGTLAAGLAEMKQFLKEADVSEQQVHLLDGSGLSRETLVTPQAVVGLLAYMYNSPHRNSFESFLPVGRVDGSLRNLFKDHPEGKNIEAKIGVLENERALSGYAHSSRYGPLAFAVMVNHSLASGAEITKFQESVLLELVQP